MNKLLFFASLLALALVSHAESQRTVWRESRVLGTPEPPPPYVLERAFAKLTFNKPIEAAIIPGTNRLLLIEQSGMLFSFPVDSSVEKADTVLDLHQFEPAVYESYSLAFHPDFLKNRFVYVMFILPTRGAPTLENGSRVVRFTLPEGEPPRIDPQSGVTLLRWASGGHNGCALRFGPDGFLYISTGDAGPAEPPDPFVTGQNLDDLLSCILRIDVDHPTGDVPYSIPADNPFVKTPGARGEIWSYGLRNPWRIAFDPVTKELYAGDVGWERWEMIHRIVRGGNSGWSITEATRQEVRPEHKQGPGPIRAPLAAHPHEEAASITGGEFYHGSDLPDLAGSYVYADWQMGTFWALKATGDTVHSHREIARSSIMPIGFGILPNRELVVCDHAGGGLWQLTPNARAQSPASFPRQLSQTGLFQNTAAQVPSAGVEPYRLSAERWNDHASALRWIAVPSADPVTIAGTGLGVQTAARWVFPVGTVFAKTYSLEMEAGNPASRRRVETQLLHFSGAQAVAYTYRWNDAQTDAELVPAQGGEQIFTVQDESSPGGVRRQTWRFNSRTECIRCHTVWNDFTPGYNARFLDVPETSEGRNQLDRLVSLGLAVQRTKPVHTKPTTPPDANPARAYLHANCATCHRKNGGGAVPTYLDHALPLAESRIVDQPPIQGTFGLPDARIVAPGDPERSVLLYRMAISGRGHMPYIGSRLVDERGIQVVRDWIMALPANSETVSDQTRIQREAERVLLAKLKNGRVESLDPLLGTASGAFSVALALTDNALPPAVRAEAIRKGAALPDTLRRDLFERFLAPDAQRKTLDPHFAPESVLAQTGDEHRGKAVFSALCATCHKVDELGIEFGPDLRAAAKRYSAAELLEHIRNPSKTIDPLWQLTTLELENRESKSGFILQRTPTEWTLRQAGGITETIPLKRIQKIQVESKISVMPEGLLLSSTAEEAADLLAWIRSLASVK